MLARFSDMLRAVRLRSRRRLVSGDLNPESQQIVCLFKYDHLKTYLYMFNA
jgi:hypothetical protein